MATDYDAPRTKDDDEHESLDALTGPKDPKTSSSVDVDENEAAESFELPGADLSGEELTVRVIPPQSDEFTCTSCFLVHHRSQLAEARSGQPVCTDCAA
ncbi:DUF4193 domain-containing protein [Puerhibacterium sp. TATVAM-FAB25]|uniref:DUF4193 domain-containing protein n=1 Tax=Puerhibacterium sp. TATVAM-FAB25 TaxID=3093699 RepID=UPI00397A5D80